MEILKCRNCGAQLDLSKAANGVIKCDYCNSIFTLPKNTSDAALSFLRQGEHDLDTCKFEEAYSAFAKAAEYDKDEPEAYWGMALAEFKVQYLKDIVNNRLQPICHGITEKLFDDNSNFKNALKYATANQRSEYVKKGAEIDSIRAEFLKLKKSDLDYDCFICTKVTKENGEHTEDSHIAAKLYKELKNAGYKPFFSDEEVRDRAGADYEALILYALYCSKCMIVVCCNEYYLQTPWVKNEYTRFLSMLKDGDKQNDSVTIVYKGTPVEKLYGRSGKIEGINYGEGDALLRVLNFVARFKEISVPKIQRKEYSKVSYTKKNVARLGVAKRQLTTVSGGEITVSERAQMNLASEFLARRDFANAIRQCDIILSKNPANGETHWLRFLAQHRCVDNEDYISNFNGVSDYEHLEKAIASADSDVRRKSSYYDVLINRIIRRNDIIAYKEYISLPESNDADITRLTDKMSGYAIQTANCQVFEEILKTVTDTDRYISMNLAFAQTMPVQNAVVYYKNILSVDGGHSEALYKIFVSLHGYSEEAVFGYCCKAENFKDIENTLYAYGYNAYATDALFYLCLKNAEQRAEDSSRLLDFILSMIPKSADKTFIFYLTKYVKKMFECGNMGGALKYNEMILSIDNLNYDAHFDMVMIKHGFSNALELIKISNNLMDDPDYFAAVNSYTERNPDSKNLFLDISSAVQELSAILNTPRRREQAFKKINVTQQGLLTCKEEVAALAEVADHTGTNYNVKEYLKTAIINLPTLILFIFALVVVAKPQLIFKNVHFGYVIGITVVGFVGLLLDGSLRVYFGRKK